MRCFPVRIEMGGDDQREAVGAFNSDRLRECLVKSYFYGCEDLH
jgi:hypothetical protein